MKKTVLRLTAGIAVALAVIFLYALAHEGGHALMVLLLGGQVTNFQVNFLRHPPQISYTGVSDPLHRALVSLAGPVLPLLLIPPATLVLRRTGSVPVKGALLLLLLALLSTTLTSAAVSLGCGLGGSQPSEDLAKFLRYSGANPFAVAAGFCVLFALSFLLAWKVGRVPAAAASVAAALRGSPQEGRQPLAARTAAAAVLLAVFAAAFSQVIGWPGSSQGGAAPPHQAGDRSGGARPR
ncbi:MAG: M50 family metallopeptidase [Limnochordia bacterium]